MRILVTGGAGFVGSHLVDRFVSDGHEVVIVDALTTGTRANLSHHDPDALTFITGRVEERGVIGTALDGVDLVFHLAAAVGVFEVIRRPLEVLRSNIHASETVFEAAAARGIRTIFTSTSEVYGKNDRDSLSETDDSIFGSTAVTRWLYAVSKATDEFIALAYAREHGFPVTIVRLFNTIGPRQSHAYGMVVPRFVRQALANEPITVFGDGSQTRCFTNVFDVIESLVRLSETPAAIGQVVNVGLPREISMLDLAHRVRELCESTSTIELVDYDEAYGPSFEDMRRRVPNVNRLRELTGYVPETDLDVTIRQIIEWMTESRAPGPWPEVVARVRSVADGMSAPSTDHGAPTAG